MQTHLDPSALTRRPFLLPLRGPSAVRICRSLDRPTLPSSTPGLILTEFTLECSPRPEQIVWIAMMLASLVAVVLAFWS